MAEADNIIKLKKGELLYSSGEDVEYVFVILEGSVKAYSPYGIYTLAKDSIAFEKSDSEAAKTYVNIIAVKEGRENDEAIQALVKVLQSDEIKNYINDTYDGAVVPFE